jgi:hypothetical protein
MAALLLLPWVGLSGLVVEGGDGPSRRCTVTMTGNGSALSARLSYLVLPQRAAWLAASSTVPLSGAIPSAESAVLVC